jgi:hypothetical protein
MLLHWWLSRGDRRTRNRIAQIQADTPWEGPPDSPPQERTILPNGN